MYQKAQLYLIYTIAEGAEEDKLYDALEKSLNLNMAFVSLKLKKYRDAINFCYQVLKHDSENLKAKYRLVVAHTELIEFKEASEVLESVLSKNAKNKDFLGLKKQLEKAVNLANLGLNLLKIAIGGRNKSKVGITRHLNSIFSSKQLLNFHDIYPNFQSFLLFLDFFLVFEVFFLSFLTLSDFFGLRGFGVLPRFLWGSHLAL